MTLDIRMSSLYYGPNLLAPQDGARRQSTMRLPFTPYVAGRISAMSALEIQMFGSLALTRDGQPVKRFPSKRVKDLLSFLLLNRGGPQQRERLAGLFWGDLDDQKARHCLNTSLWRLHQVLAQPKDAPHPYLRVDAQTIGFNTASGFLLDVAEFENR